MDHNLSNEEIMNNNSYSTDNQVKIYDKENLTEVESSVFAKWITGKQKILDVGCGVGRTTINLHRRGHDVIGIDLNEKMIAQAHKKYPDLEFVVMNASQLKFPDESFDIVLFSFNGLDCIYPTEKRWQTVKEMRRVLKPGGLFIMSSHNKIIWPTNKYTLFWWIFNILTGRIFTDFRYEYKGFRIGEKFIYYTGWPKRQIKNITNLGFKLEEIFGNSQFKFLRKILRQTKNLCLITLFDPYPYYVYRKQ